MGLNEEDKSNIIKYRIQKSFETLKEAKDNATMSHWSLVANRLY